jgi:raffinose/stachyose/melibiose transport system substrate-binding protein
MPRTRRSKAIALITTLPVLLAVACGGDDGDGDGGQAGSELSGTLRLWHYETPNSAMGIAWDRAIEVFEETYPDVTVEFEERGFEQIRQTAQMVLNSPDGPDIMEYNKGNATAGLLSSQGLLADLTEEAEERGWADMLSPSLETTAVYNEDGEMGSGNWYGVPNYGEFVLVYYNREMFAEHGLEVPTTLEEFETVLDTFVGAGVTPLAVGGAEYPAQQIWYQLVLANADRDFVNDFQLYENEVDFHGEAMTAGTEKFTEWVEAGYISPDATGIVAEDMGVSFTRGDFPILISGTWWFGRFVDEIAFDWGTLPFPGTDLNLGSSGNIWVVNENSENKEAAYAFIDITMTEEIQNLLGNSGGIPVSADPEAITDERNRELIESFNTIVENDGLAFYPDWPAPGYYDTLVAAVQDLMSGDTSQDQFLDSIAGPYQDANS